MTIPWFFKALFNAPTEPPIEPPASLTENHLKWWSFLTTKEQKARMVRTFQRVFSTPDGIFVLTLILEDLHFFSVTTDADGAALKNYATDLLKNRLGVTDPFAAVTKLLEIGNTQEVVRHGRTD